MMAGQSSFGFDRSVAKSADTLGLKRNLSHTVCSPLSHHPVPSPLSPPRPEGPQRTVALRAAGHPHHPAPQFDLSAAPRGAGLPVCRPMPHRTFAQYLRVAQLTFNDHSERCSLSQATQSPCTPLSSSSLADPPPACPSPIPSLPLPPPVDAGGGRRGPLPGRRLPPPQPPPRRPSPRPVLRTPGPPRSVCAPPAPRWVGTSARRPQRGDGVDGGGAPVPVRPCRHRRAQAALPPPLRPLKSFEYEAMGDLPPPSAA